MVEAQTLLAKYKYLHTREKILLAGQMGLDDLPGEKLESFAQKKACSMNIIKFTALFLLLLFLNSHSSHALEESQKGVAIKKRDLRTGLFLDTYHTQQDQGRLSLIVHGDKSPLPLKDFWAAEISYAHRLQNFWLEVFAQRANARFGQIAHPLFSTEEKEKEQEQEQRLPQELLSNIDTLTFFGAGLVYRGTWIQDLVQSNLVFTSTSASLGMATLNNSFLWRRL